MGLRYICNLDAHNILNIQRRRELLHFNVLTVSFSLVSCVHYVDFFFPLKNLIWVSTNEEDFI